LFYIAKIFSHFNKLFCDTTVDILMTLASVLLLLTIYSSLLQLLLYLQPLLLDQLLHQLFSLLYY